MAANEAEAPAAQVAAGDEAAEKYEASVGVLGWLGFITVNFAAWGMIFVAWEIVWELGCFICASYTVGLIGLAVLFERRDPVKFHRFLNLLWVLAATFLCVTGTFIAVQFIGQLGRDDASSSPTPSPTPSSYYPGNPEPPPVSSALPDNASAALREWATADHGYRDMTDNVVFNGSLFFHGHSASEGHSVLLRSAGGNISRVTITHHSWVGDSGWGFVEYQSDLYFFTDSRNPCPVLRVSAGDLDTAVAAFNVPSGRITALFVEGPALYVKATWECACNYRSTLSLFRSDGTDNGTVDLRADQRSTYCGCDHDHDREYEWTPHGDPGLFNRVALWSTMFVAVVPMMALAGFVLVKKQLPGLFVNLYFGVEAVVIIAYFAITYDSEDSSWEEQERFEDFVKVFLFCYNSLLWVLLAAWSLAQYKLPGWEESRQEDLKSWAAACVGVSFFVILHVVTEVPATDEAGGWIGYAAGVLAQILLSAIVSQTVPMVMGAIGLFILAYKISVGLTEVMGQDGSEFEALIVLAILALQGLAIIMGAIFYASKREKIEGAVSALFRCDKEALREMGARPHADMEA